MSFFDRLGNFAKDLGGAAIAPAKLVWDIGTAGWNDSEEFNGFSNIVKSSGKNFISSLIKPMADVAAMPGVMTALQKIDDINQQVVRRPLTTLLLTAQGAEGGIARAYEEADDNVSFGQAAVGLLGQAFIDDDFDIYDKKQREEMFKDNMLGKLTSGTFDLGINIFGDVTLVAGKGAKALRASSLVTDAITKPDDIARVGKEIRRALNGEQNKYADFADLMAQSDAFAASNHPLVKNSAEPTLLAAAFGVAKDRNEALKVLQISIGDKKALAEFTAQHAYMKEAFDQARNQHSLLNDYLTDPSAFNKWNEFTPGLQGMDVVRGERVKSLNAERFGGAVSEMDLESKARWTELMKEQASIMDSMRRDFPDMDKVLGLAKAVEQEGSLLTRTVGSMATARGFDKKLMTVRTDAALRGRIVRVFQPTPYNNLVQAVHFATGERPAGIFNMEDPDSSREMVAVASRMLKLADGSMPSRSMRGIVNVEGGKYKYFDKDGVEHVIDGITSEKARDYVNRYVSAANPTERLRVASAFEEASFSAIAAKHGLSPAAAKTVYNEIARHRKTTVDSMREFGFAIDTDGSKIISPLFESQTANFVPMMDFDLLDKSLSKAGTVGLLEDIHNFGGNVLTVAGVLNDMFKAGALLRLGYTMRNTLEAQLRIAATLGTFGSMRYLGPGAKNFFENMPQRGKRLIDNVQGVATGRTAILAERTRKNSLAKIAEYQRRLNALPDDIEGAAARHQLEALIKEHQDIVARNTVDPKDIGKVKGIGQGEIKIASRYTLTDGTKAYVLDDALGGPLAGLRERLISSESSRVRLVNETAQIVGSRMKSNGWGNVNPSEPHYWSEWANTLNTVLRNSQISRRLAGGSSQDEVAAWLKSMDGRAVRKELGLTIDEVDGHMELVGHFFNNHVPNEEIAAKLLSKELFTAEGLQQLAANIKDLQPIQGTVLKEAFSGENQNMLRKVVNGAFRFIGTMPEDKLARQPFYIMAYRDALKKNIDKAEYFKGRALIGPEELWAVQQSAHRDAMRLMKKTLFNVERRTNAATALRLIAPFFSAYENSIKTWGRIAYNNPSIAYKGYLLSTAPNRMGIATDQDGNLVPVEKASMDDTIWLPIPQWTTRIPFIGEGLEPFVTQRVGDEKIVGGLGISKRSLDVIFQGGVDFPFGPYVALPVSEIVRRRPELEDTLKWAIPYGPTDAASVLPTWLRRQLQKTQGEDSPQYANFFSLIWQTEMQKFRLGLRDEPTAKEIESKTNAYYNMHSLANLILPFAPKFNTPYRFYVDQYHQYQQKFGINAQQKFYEDFGDDFFGFTASLSSNVTGATATVSSVQRAKKYSGLIAMIAEDDPKLVGVITDDGTIGEFSKAAYTWQQENAIAPGSKTTFREKGDPIQADNRNRAQLGWIKFNKAKSALDMELAARGLTSYEAKYADDLKARKDQMMIELAQEYPEWYDDYLDTDGSKVRRVVRGLTRIVDGKSPESQKFMADNRSNPTWRSVVAYLSARQMVQQQLQFRSSKSLAARENSDLQMLWDATVNRLIREDIGFEDLYNRFLTQDMVWDKTADMSGGIA